MHLCNIAIMDTKNPNSNIICDEEVYEANIYVFKKPVSPGLVPTLMDVNSQPKYTMPVENYIAFVKGRLSYEEALNNITEKTCYSIVRDTALRERDAKKPRRKRRWGRKTRNPFRHYLKINIGFREAYEIALYIAIAVVKLLGPCMQAKSRVGRPITYDAVKMFAALLVKRLFNLSFERLSLMLRGHGISLALSGEAYPCASTLYNYYLKIGIRYYQLAILILYLKIFSKYIAYFGVDLHMGLDSCFVRLDHYAEGFRKGYRCLAKACFKFYAWCWLKWNAIAFVAFSKKGLLSFSKLVPGGVLLADGEFSDRNFLMMLNKRFKLAVNIRFSPWIGFRMEDCYQLRKLVERVFGCLERRKCLYSMFKIPGSIKRDICLACFAHNVVCLLSVVKCCSLFTRL